MLTIRGTIERGWVLGAVLVAAACEVEMEGPAGESVDRFRKGGNGGGNGSGGGGGGGIWIGNGLTDLDLDDVDPAHGLDTQAGLHPDPDGAELAAYLVECALPAGDSILKTIDGQVVELPGVLGLAPEWKDSPCEEDCQEWVSACLLARFNVSGEFVALWLTADHPAIGLGQDPSQPVHEATFYGNLFQDPDGGGLCRGSQNDQLAERTCDGQPVEDCGLTDWGSCSASRRCALVGGFATDCATGGNPATGERHNSISTFVSP